MDSVTASLNRVSKDFCNTLHMRWTRYDAPSASGFRSRHALVFVHASHWNGTWFRRTVRMLGHWTGIVCARG